MYKLMHIHHMYICMDVCMVICTYMRVCVCECVCMHGYMHVCLHFVGKVIPCLFKSFVDKYTTTGVSKTIEVYYKHEEVQIRDIFLFKVHMLVDSTKVCSYLIPAV